MYDYDADEDMVESECSINKSGYIIRDSDDNITSDNNADFSFKRKPLVQILEN